MSSPFGRAIAAILHLPPSPTHDLPRRVDDGVRLIIEASAREGVDPVAVIGLCVLESGLQSRNRRASLCGCQPYATSPRAQARCAAAAYRRALARCREEPKGAMMIYVWGGGCNLPARPTRGPVEWRSHLLSYRASWVRIMTTLRTNP